MFNGDPLSQASSVSLTSLRTTLAAMSKRACGILWRNYTRAGSTSDPLTSNIALQSPSCKDLLLSKYN